MASAGSKKVIIAALIGNALVAFSKFIAATITGSSAMFSEGIHSVVDTGNQALLLFGISRAKRPPTEEFPFGYGKEIYFWSFVVAMLLFSVGAGLSIYEGIHRIYAPTPITNPVVNYIVLGLAICFEAVAWIMAYKQFSKEKGSWSIIEAVKREKNPTTFVVLFEDTAAIIGLLIALLGVALSSVTGMAIFDGIASLVIGLVLGLTAWWLAIETKGLLIGESANKEVVEQIRKLALSNEGITHVNELLTLHMGPEYVLVNIAVDFKDHLSATEIESTVALLDTAIKRKHPRVKRVFIEAESRSKR